jgi:hypothetical protein
MFFTFKKCKIEKKYIVPPEPAPTQTDVRSISTIYTNANEHARIFKTSEMRRPIRDAPFMAMAFIKKTAS